MIIIVAVPPQTCYQLVPDSRNREAVQHLLLNCMLRCPEEAELPVSANPAPVEMEDADEGGTG